MINNFQGTCSGALGRDRKVGGVIRLFRMEPQSLNFPDKGHVFRLTGSSERACLRTGSGDQSSLTKSGVLCC